MWKVEISGQYTVKIAYKTIMANRRELENKFLRKCGRKVYLN